MWVLAKVEGNVRIRDVDAIERYLLLSTGHDGRTAVQIRFTPVRVVCQNTLTLAHSFGKDFAKVYHVPGLRNQLDNVQKGCNRLSDRVRHAASWNESRKLVRLSPYNDKTRV